MSILVIEQGDNIELSHQDFINKYADNPYVAAFTHESIGIILDHINERQQPNFFTHDLDWEADFKAAEALSYKDIFIAHQVGNDADALPLLELIQDTYSLKISLLDNPKNLSSLLLLKSILPALLENEEYLESAAGLIVDDSHHVYREIEGGWLRLTIGR